MNCNTYISQFGACRICWTSTGNYVKKRGRKNISHCEIFNIYSYFINTASFGLLTTRFHIRHRSGQSLVKSWVSACVPLLNQCCHHIKKWFSDPKIIGHMAFTAQMIGSRKKPMSGMLNCHRDEWTRYWWWDTWWPEEKCTGVQATVAKSGTSIIQLHSNDTSNPKEKFYLSELTLA